MNRKKALVILMALILSAAALSGCIGGLLAWELLKVIDRYHLVPKRTVKEGRGAR